MVNGMSILANRAMSSYTLSIGTALAMESIDMGPSKPYDEARVIPNKVDINKYEVVYINLMTLYRNIIGSVNKQDADKLMVSDLVSVLEDEVNIIRDIFSVMADNRIEVIFYCSKYHNLKAIYPNSNIRGDNTEKQIQYTMLMQQVINEYMKNNTNASCKLFENKIITTKPQKCLMITHYAYDLLSYNSFTLLDLLETHTGILKNKSMFYTKLLNGKDLVRIPFNEITLQIFGDKEMFIPMPMKVKTLVLGLAEKYNWTQVTTKDRIKYGFDQIEDQELSRMLKSL